MPKTIIEQRERFQVARQNPEFKAQNLGALAAVEDTASFLGETGLDEANKLIVHRSKVQLSQFEREFQTQLQERKLKALTTPGLDGQALAAQLADDREQAYEAASQKLGTNLSFQLGERMKADLIGGAEREANQLVLQRTQEIELANTEDEIESLREEMSSAPPERQAELRQRGRGLIKSLLDYGIIDAPQEQKRRQAFIRETREIMAFTEVDTRLGLKDGKFNHEKGLKFAEGVKFGKEMRDEDMTPDERVQLGNQLISYVGALKEQQSGSRAWDRLTIREAKKQAARGRLVPEYAESRQRLAEDPDFADDVFEIEQTYAAATYADSRTPEEAAQELDSLKSLQNPSVGQSIQMKALEDRIKQVQSVQPKIYRQSEAAEFLRIPGTAPVDWSSDPQTLASQVHAASRTGAGLNQQLTAFGRKGRVLAISDQSLGELTQILDQNNHGESYQKLSVLANGLSNAQYSDIVSALPKEHQLKAYAATLPPAAALTVLRGQERIKEIGRPPADAYVPVFTQDAGEALRRMPKTRALALDATEAFVVALAGKDATQDTVEQAIESVVGTVAERNGSKFILPQGMDESRFEASFEALAKNQYVRGWGNPVDAQGRSVSIQNVVEHGQLISIGNGLYQVTYYGDDDNPIQDGDNPGKAWVLNLGEILGAR